MSTRLTEPSAIDTAVEVLVAHKDEWARLDFPRRLSLLADLRRRVGAVAEAWAVAGVVAKGIPLDSPTSGEEWLSGPYTSLTAIAALHRSLGRLWQGTTTFDPDWVARDRAGGPCSVPSPPTSPRGCCSRATRGRCGSGPRATASPSQA